MVGRIILTVMILALCFITIQVVEQKVAPSHASDLAIEQIKEKGAREQLRIEQNTQNWLYPLCSLATIGFLVIIWEKPVVKLCKKIKG